MIMKTATTILELSKLLKLSPSTVSRALKNHPDIAPETRKKILELANKLDYEPNLNAVGLRTSDSKEFAVIVPNLSGFFYDSFITSVEEEARKIGHSLIVLLSGDDPVIESENVKICRQRRVKGVLVCVTPTTSETEQFQRLLNQEIPVVFFDKIPSSEKFNTVRVADEDAARLAAEYLISKGKEKILSLFGDFKMSISEKRLTVFRNIFSLNGQSGNLIIHEAASSKAAEKIVTEAFKSPVKPDAVFCMSDEILIGVMKAIQTLKVVYPHDAGILAISNGFFPKLYAPEITYVETSGIKLGKLAFQRVLECVEGDARPVDLTVKSQLIEGASI
jgi:LacI family transcriptional regulator